MRNEAPPAPSRKELPPMANYDAAPWQVMPDGSWQYIRPPYRGVLVIEHQYSKYGSEEKQFSASIEAPEGTQTAPYAFREIRSAQQWIEREVTRLAITSGHLPERRRGERRHSLPG